MAKKQPVEPKDAASLILVDDGADEPEVLMGRREPRSSFMPHMYVFPGGRMDADDRQARPATGLAPEVLDRLCRSCPEGEPQARGLANAVVRETFEETGLLLAGPGDVGDVGGPDGGGGTWSQIRALGMAPAHDRLDYVGRAITPEASPIRFHARFFMARAADTTGTLGGNGELLDLDWYPLSKALALPVADITEFMLGEVHGLSEDQAANRKARFFTYKKGKSFIAYD